MAIRYNSHHSLNMFPLEISRWNFPEHTHNFYELIFVEDGTGTHIQNDVSAPFKKGSIFLLTPEDRHRFVIRQNTSFYFIKFTDSLFTNTSWRPGNTSLENLLQQDTNDTGEALPAAERKHLFALLKRMKAIHSKPEHHSHEVLLHFLSAMLLIISDARESPGPSKFGASAPESDRVRILLRHLRTHLLDPQQLRLSVIANVVGLSPNYVGEFLLRHTGVPLRTHIAQARMKMADQLLKNSDLTINEIAHRLGFHDGGHFSKAYRNAKGKTPGSVRAGSDL